MFQHAAARRRLGGKTSSVVNMLMFQHAAARRRLVGSSVDLCLVMDVSTRSRPKAAGSPQNLMYDGYVVSTRSRPKAAGFRAYQDPIKEVVSTRSRPKAAGKAQKHACGRWAGFNTQPPEGGWPKRFKSSRFRSSFNTQPPEGGWVAAAVRICLPLRFQHAAARRRLAKPL